MWEQDPKKTEPVVYIAGRKLPLSNFVPLFSGHPVLHRRWLLDTIRCNFVCFGFFLCLAHFPAISASREGVVIAEDMGP